MPSAKASPLAIVLGVVIFLASFALVFLSFLAPMGDGPGGSLWAPIAAGVGALIGALIAGGSGGRKRIGVALGALLIPLLVVLRPRSGVRMAQELWPAIKHTPRPWALGAILILAGAILLAKPAVKPIMYEPYVPRSQSSAMGPGAPPPHILEAMRSMPPEMLTPEMRAMLHDVALPTPEPFSYTSETHMAYLIAGGLLALLGLLMILLPAGDPEETIVHPPPGGGDPGAAGPAPGGG